MYVFYDHSRSLMIFVRPIVLNLKDMACVILHVMRCALSCRITYEPRTVLCCGVILLVTGPRVQVTGFVDCLCNIPRLPSRYKH